MMMVDKQVVLYVLTCMFQIITQPSRISCHIINYINGMIEREAEGGDTIVFYETISHNDGNLNGRTRRQVNKLESSLITNINSICNFPEFSNVVQKSMEILNNGFIVLNAKQANLTEEVGKIRSRKARVMIIWVHYYDDQKFSKMLLGSASRRVVGPTTKTIVIMANEKDNKAQTLKLVFKHVFDQITRLEVLVFVKKGCEFGLVKMFKFEEDSFQNNLELINWKVNGSFMEKVPTNFQGYRMRIGFPNCPPYVLKGNKKSPPTGVEIEIIRTIVQHLNMTPKYVPAPPIYLKYTGRTLCIMFMLLNSKGQFGADIGCGDLTFQSEHLDIITPLFPFSFRQSIFSAIRPIQYDKTRSLYGMLSTNVWFLVILTSISLIIAMYIGTKVHDGKVSLTVHIVEVLGTHVDASFSKAILSSSSKTIGGIVLLYVVVLSTLYKANLKVSVTVPYVIPPIRSCLEAVDANLSFYLMIDDKPSLIQNPFHEIALGKNSLFYFSDVDLDVQGVQDNGAGVLFKDKDTLEYLFLTNDYSQYIVNFIYENTVTRPVSIVMTPGHPLQPLFDRLQSFLVEGGFPNLWHGDTFHKLSLKHKNFKQQDDRKPMTLDNLSPIFYLLCGMIILDSLTFIVECSYHHIRSYISRRKEKSSEDSYSVSTSIVGVISNCTPGDDNNSKDSTFKSFCNPDKMAACNLGCSFCNK